MSLFKPNRAQISTASSVLQVCALSACGASAQWCRYNGTIMYKRIYLARYIVTICLCNISTSVMVDDSCWWRYIYVSACQTVDTFVARYKDSATYRFDWVYRLYRFGYKHGKWYDRMYQIRTLSNTRAHNNVSRLFQRAQKLHPRSTKMEKMA